MNNAALEYAANEISATLLACALLQAKSNAGHNLNAAVIADCLQVARNGKKLEVERARAAAYAAAKESS